ncbi:MAG: phytanoyl-CoA dioxygenase family protein [Candidatus Poribacteria bacterium]|nr:phytanoyl-CoA dioxygenase family protein [Candidatus Poribacteria bacterium]
MDNIEQYEFDRQGFLVLKDFLTSPEVATLAPIINKLVSHGEEHYTQEPRKQSKWGSNYHFNAENGYHVSGGTKNGETIIIEDFFNSDPAFDCLVNHPKTMAYITKIVQGEIGINNSELRVRYTGNASGSHGGGPTNPKYRYAINDHGIDAMMVRIIYFVQDIDSNQGAFSVVPGTHKTRLPMPYKGSVDEEPGMIGLEVKAGDAILFTENLRHGGLTNQSNQVRKTLHVGYGPAWMMSQNISTMDEVPYINPETWHRYDQGQRELFQAWLRTEPEHQTS